VNGAGERGSLKTGEALSALKTLKKLAAQINTRRREGGTRENIAWSPFKREQALRELIEP
jgi:hypothetical protein